MKFYLMPEGFDPTEVRLSDLQEQGVELIGFSDWSLTENRPEDVVSYDPGTVFTIDTSQDAFNSLAEAFGDLSSSLSLQFDNVTEKFVALMLDYWDSLPWYLKMWYRIKAVPLVVANKAVKFWRWLTKEEVWLSN